MLAAAREFFAVRGVLEVETPILSAAAVSDPQIESLATRVAGMAAPAYLCTSPEYAMKRLLAAGQRRHLPDMQGVSRRRARPLAQPGVHPARMVPSGVRRCGADGRGRGAGRLLLAPDRRLEPAERLSYAAALQRHAGVDVHSATAGESGRRGAAPRHRLPGGTRPRRQARSLDGTRRGSPLGIAAPVLHLRLPGLAGRAGTIETGTYAGRGALRALRRWTGTRQRLS